MKHPYRLLLTATLVAAALVVTGVDVARAGTTRCHGLTVTKVGTAADDVIHGTSGRDVIAGLGGSDTIYGLGGNDVVCGGRGADRLYGGAGNDRLYGGSDRLYRTDEGSTERDGDVLRGGSGDDQLVPGGDDRVADEVNLDTLAWDTAAHPVRIDVAAGTANGAGHDTFDARHAWILGSDLGDTIVGSDRADHINGGPGSDTISGRGGPDRVIADSGSHNPHAADVVHGGAGNDEISATEGQDRLYGGSGADVVDDVGNSADVMFGGPGADMLIGELSGNGKPQRFSGGSGTDTLNLFTNLLNPTPVASTGSWDMATGAMTFDAGTAVTLTADGFENGGLSSYGTTWTVDGTPGADDLVATGTNGTTFHGLGGDDSFFGSAYDDVFDGGVGTDRSKGMGVGDDTCVSVEVYDAADCEHTS